jgi:hypothetical protein
MTICKNCGKGIKWFKDLVNDKWIPLEADCNLDYENAEEVDMDEVLQWKHKCTAILTCNKGGGTQIYFDLFRENDTDGGSNARESYLWWHAARKDGFFYMIRSILILVLLLHCIELLYWC